MARKTKASKIRDAIENYEYYNSGKKNLNGGYAEADHLRILTRKNHYKVYCQITLGDYFDAEHPHKEIFSNCWYHLDKKDFHILNSEECKKLGITINDE